MRALVFRLSWSECNGQESRLTAAEREEADRIRFDCSFSWCPNNFPHS